MHISVPALNVQDMAQHGLGISQPPGSLGLPKQDVLDPIFSESAHPLKECMDIPRGDGCLKPLAAHSPCQGLFQVLPTHPTAAVPNTLNTSHGCSCLGDALGLAFPMAEPRAIPWTSLAVFNLAGLDPAQRHLFYPFRGAQGAVLPLLQPLQHSLNPSSPSSFRIPLQQL